MCKSSSSVRLYFGKVDLFSLSLSLLSSVEPCKETEKSSDKGDTDSPQAKTEDKENKPGMHAIDP